MGFTTVSNAQLQNLEQTATLALKPDDAHAMQSAALHVSSQQARPLNCWSSLPYNCCFLSLCIQAGCAESSSTDSGRL